MKTIDEVIKAIDCLIPVKLKCEDCPYEEFHVKRKGLAPVCMEMLVEDTKYYLQEHQKVLKKTRRERLYDALREVRGEK